MELYLTEAWSEARNSLQIVKLSSFTPVLQIRAFKKVLTTNNTSYSTKCFDYFANELSKFQTQ